LDCLPSHFSPLLALFFSFSFLVLLRSESPSSLLLLSFFFLHCSRLVVVVECGFALLLSSSFFFLPPLLLSVVYCPNPSLYFLSLALSLLRALFFSYSFLFLCYCSLSAMNAKSPLSSPFLFVLHGLG
jgi:hypothetical protein